ncbi:hypothetical protein FAD94_002870 [Enterococcus faecalis]|uniref:hypothetical protein n=1 Tax=Enterococcus faecalis TaxID=1351 RepID=UPI000CF127B6|nr:hypothetical protein [Enterococcus faecalis]EGO8127757.1 hypothetical protein [Enterococcus faecalis]MCU9757163.1 hypothetical protein [Enterococcus faecalis]MCU9774318.1 hypothetical protein [Enterococcus faecalis]MCU9790712.1 hypothetical protein [Enterococcus faecalis]PQC69492.1 hypothetical protein CUN08_10565 [Enterococcus faecalis]
MTVKQTIMTFAVTAMMMMGMATTANADTLDTVAKGANQTTQVANYAKDKVNKDGLIETIDKNRGNIEELVNKGGEFAYSFGNKLDEAVSYTKETENKKIFAKTSNFVSILFTDKTKEQVLNEENQDKSIVETAKEQVANNDLKVSTKQAIKYQFNKSGFSNIPEGFEGFLLVGIRVLLGIIVISTIGLAIIVIKNKKNTGGDIKSKNAKINRAYDRGQNLLSRIR